MATSRGPVIVTDGLLLYLDALNKSSYPGVGMTWYDLSGYHNDGLLNGDPVYDGRSLDFDSTDNINCGDINPITAETLSIWVKLDSIPSTQSSLYPGLISKRIGGTQRAYFFAFRRSTNDIYWEIKDEDGTYHVLSSIKNTWTTTEWYCLDVTFDGTTGLAEIYVDGQLDASDTFVLDHVPYTTSDCYIGGAQYPFAGKVGVAKIYNRALTALEHLQNFNALKARYGK